MPTTHVPQYPVVDHSPSFSRVFGNFTVTEWCFAAGMGVAGNAIGWLGGKIW